MALTVGELNAILSVDDRAVDPALRRAENAIRDAGRQMGDDAERAGEQAGEELGDGLVRGADGRLRDARGRFAAAGRAAGDAAGEGLTEGTEEGADQAVDQAAGRMDRLKMAAAGAGLAAGAALMAGFQEAMNQAHITAVMGAQLGATPGEAQRYGQLAGELFKDAIVADFQEAADTIKAVMNAGLAPPNATNAQLKSISTNVADLATVLGMDVGEAANAAGIMVRNGLAKNAAEAIDMLIQASNQGANRFGDLGETITQSADNLSHFGLTGQQALGVMIQGLDAGAPSAEVFAGALEEMAANAGDGAELFDQLGFNGKQMAKDLAGGGPEAATALDKLMDKLRGMKDPTERSAAMVELFGEEAVAMQDALLAVDPSEATGKLGSFGGAADKAGDTLRDNAAHKLTEFKNSLQQNLVEFLGGTVIPKLSGFFTFAKNNAPLLLGLATAVTALGVAFATAAIGVWAMNSAMLANPMFWIIAGIVMALAGLVLLVVTYWDEIKSATGAAWDWVVDKISAAKDGVLAAVEWLGQIPGWVAGWFGDAKDWAVRKFTELTTWLQGLPGRAANAISGLGTAVTSLASNAWQSFRDASVKKALAFITWVKGLPGRIASGIGSLGNLLVTKGQDVVRGLWRGIQSMGSWLRSTLIGWAKSMIPGPIAKALGIASPSKVTAKQGKWIAKGLVVGLTGSAKQVRAASAKLASIVRDSLNPGKKRSKALGRISSGTKQLMALATREARLADRLKTATKRLADQIKARDKLAADVKKGVLESADITQQETGGWPQTAETILAGLKQDRAAAEQFAKNLETLSAKGVSKDLIAQIAAAGVEQGSSAAAALANANSDQIKAINKEQGALVGAAGKAGDAAGNAMYGAGIRAGQGLVRGLKMQQKVIEKQMLHIAKGMSKAIKKALGIKSPSRVMAQVGAYTAEGLRQGIEGGRRAVNRSMASLVETPAPGSWDMASGRARAAASQRVVLELRSSGRAEDDYLMGRVRRGIRKVGGPDATFALTGRRTR
ncbi:phage tail tape measure protein [Streptomyces sp. NPDC052773]|uniref:phage tail tape measure protein n=1 Tax=Streptomyces sp. NPDC052773 TaxID=3365693 RepID=UPI0037D83C95